MKIKLNLEGTIKDAQPSVLAARIIDRKYHKRQIICTRDLYLNTFQIWSIS
jgi:hypothetical protein